MDPEKKTIKVGILTISDTRTPSKSNTETFDSSGCRLKELVNNSKVIKSSKVVLYDCVTDDIEKIQAKMIDWCSSGKIDVLISTGGTGLSPRDVTPEATLGVVQKLTPGISQAIMNESLKITPMAMLSRAVSGIYEKTLIINLPGSTKAADECLHVVACVIPHAVTLIRDEKKISNEFHNQLNSKAKNKIIIPECVSKVAHRHRQSPFPKISMTLALNILKEHSSLFYTEKNKMMYPTVCIFSTGDELQTKEEADRGYIRDTNSVMIKQILEQDDYMGKVFICGIVRDNWNDLCNQFEELFQNADIVVTSGGVSMGEKDMIKNVLKEHFKGHIHFGRVDMKPGMPTTFVTLSYKDKKKYVICLPGNPVSAGVCTHLFVLPYLRSVSGRKSIIHSFKAELTHSIENLDMRPEFRRALLKYENGKFWVSCLTSYQQSSRLMSFVGSNCLIQLPSSSEKKTVLANTVVDVIVIKSIENMYIAPILKENILKLEVLQNQDVKKKKDNIQSFTHTCIIDVLNLMTKDFTLKTEIIPTISSMGYTLSEAVYSSENLPPFQASIKDGYAIKFDGSWHETINIFKVVQVSVAGTIPNCLQEIGEGECSRISTGAPLPPGANCVVQVEDTTVIDKSTDGTVEITIAIMIKPKHFDNIRDIGTDISEGQQLLELKTEMGPFEIALLRSVGCEEIPVYKHPTIHIIPYTIGSAHGTSKQLHNMFKSDGFKGNVFCHNLCNNLANLSEKYEDLFQNDDIIVFCQSNSIFEFPHDKNFDIKTHLHIKNDKLKISLGFGIVYFKEKRIFYFYTTSCDSDSIYKCVHLFLLPFLRFTTGRKIHIPSVKTQLIAPFDLSYNIFERAQLDYEDGNFNITWFTTDHQSCLVHLPSTKEMNSTNAKNELDVIVTENSDSYFIHY